MLILGAGMAGLIAANLLRRHKPTIIEKQDKLPNNHTALLRFRNDAISKATGIPFKKVNIHKAIFFEDRLVNESNIKLSNMYAQKVTGSVVSRSIMDLRPAERWIAPPDFIQLLALSCCIEYGTDAIEAIKGTSEEEKVISTLPMPMLLKRLSFKHLPEFKSKPIYTISGTFKNPSVDVYQTIYFPEKRLPWYRMSITGNRFIAEIDDIAYFEDQSAAFMEGTLTGMAGNFGIAGAEFSDVVFHKQAFGKILPIPDEKRKGFIMELSDFHHIFSLGRFATWRQILLDDLVKDIEVIDSMIEQRDRYKRTLHFHQ